ETSDSTIALKNIVPAAPFDQDGNLHQFSNLSSNIALDRIGTRFSFSPEGNQVAFTRRTKNRFGEEYNDLYLFDIKSGKTEKVTESARVHDPDWHPRKNRIVAVKYGNGSHHLVELDLDTSVEKKLISFPQGTTIYTPVWSPDGNSILYASSLTGKRDLYRYDLELDKIKTVLSHEGTDYRDAWMDSEDKYLYFSSDADGIFNIYRMDLQESGIQKLTDRVGGAFMPFVRGDTLYFSDFRAGGYKIVSRPLPEFTAVQSFKGNKSIGKSEIDTDLTIPQHYFDRLTTEIKTAHESLEASLESDVALQLDSSPENSSEAGYRWSPFNQTTTGLSVIPVVRFDNYSKLKGSNSKLLKRGDIGDLGRNLIRDFKIGAYFESRNVLENFTLFGGALFGFGSRDAESVTDFFSPDRLNQLDRDLFLILEREGLPLIKRSWSPTVSLELYNLKRNVKDGLTIEEFPCTSCLPVNKPIDIRYSIWEASLYLRSKLNRWSMLEFGGSYSPSSVSTEGFFSDEFKQFIPGSTTEYFRGTRFSTAYITDLTTPYVHSDIAPIGFRSASRFELERGELLDSFELSDGTLSPVYDSSVNYSAEVRARYGFDFMGVSNGLITSRFFTYLNDPTETFYLDYTGGLSGMRSYPYFAIGGQQTFFTRLSLLTPLKQQINRQAGAYILDKLYGHLFFETGNGWGGPLKTGNNLKTGVGAEIRLAMQGYYNYPLKLFFSATYGFNSFDVTLPDPFIRVSGDNSVEYGRELLFYFGLTFDFDQF
ncbi:MAG: hypothetical protein R3222_09780, partial [Balneolaceae bacterium]|nr:hypothetical protein [Balneolaceae bacterium]